MNDNNNSMSKQFFKDFLSLIVVVLAVYFVTLRFIFPGYFSPLIPHHGDFYTFFTASPHETLSTLFMSPRFVGIFVRDIMGILGMKSMIIFLILLNSVSIALTILLIKTVARAKFYWPVMILYLFLIFSHPGFYIKYSYDFFDALAYFFAVCAMFFWYKNIEKIKNKQILIVIALLFLSLFSKETYFVPLFIFWCYQCFFSDKKQRVNTVVILTATVLIFILSILHSHFVSSPWVSIESGKADSYFIDIHPTSIIETYLYYLKIWGNLGVIGLVSISLITSFISKKYFKETILFLVVGLATYIPYSLLPNHKFACYFWLAVPLSYSVILFINPSSVRLMIGKLNNGKLYKGLTIVLIVAIVFFGAFSLKQFNKSYKDVGLQWTLFQENINRNMLANLPYMKNNISPSDKVLLTGLAFPFHPFVNPGYIDSYFGISQNVKWIVAVYDDVNEDKFIGSIEFLGIKKVDMVKFDKIFVFDSMGNLIKMTEGDKIDLNETDLDVISENDVILFPELNKYIGALLKKDDWYAYMQVGSAIGKVYPDRGEYFLNKSIQLVKESNPYPYFHMGQLMEGLNRNEDAFYNYNKATELDKSKNESFIAAVKRIKKLLK